MQKSACVATRAMSVYLAGAQRPKSYMTPALPVWTAWWTLVLSIPVRYLLLVFPHCLLSPPLSMEMALVANRRNLIAGLININGIRLRAYGRQKQEEIKK